jgi:hypothetical protein
MVLIKVKVTAVKRVVRGLLEWSSAFWPKKGVAHGTRGGSIYKAICKKAVSIVEEVSKSVRSMATRLKKRTPQRRSIVPTNNDADHGNPTKDTSKWELAAKLVQSGWRDRRLRAVNHNVDTLRSNLLEYVNRKKALGSEDFLLIFSYAVYSSLCDTCFIYFDCSLYEDGETYLVADVSIKCKGPEAEAYAASGSYVAFMSFLFPLGIPLYYLWSLYRMRNFIDPKLSCIVKDSDYAAAFAVSGVYTYEDESGIVWTKKPKKRKETRRTSILVSTLDNMFQRKSTDNWIMRFENEGKEMSLDQLDTMKDILKTKWIKENRALAKSLEGKDYKYQFEQQQLQFGFQKAKQIIKRKARAASIPARRFKFLWGPYRTSWWYFEVIDMFRRFLVLGLPKLLRVLAPQSSGMILGIGLLVMSVSPVAVSQMDPYDNRNDAQLMIFTQLTQTVIVLCGLVRKDVQGTAADLIVTAIIMTTLLPMLLLLLLYIWDPRLAI